MERATRGLIRCGRTPLGPDGVAGTRDDDLRLASGSPCIDAGDSAALPADGADTDEDCDVYEPVPRDVAGHARFADDLLTVDGGIGGPPVVDMGGVRVRRLQRRRYAGPQRDCAGPGAGLQRERRSGCL